MKLPTEREMREAGDLQDRDLTDAEQTALIDTLAGAITAFGLWRVLGIISSLCKRTVETVPNCPITVGAAALVLRSLSRQLMNVRMVAHKLERPNDSDISQDG